MHLTLCSSACLDTATHVPHTTRSTLILCQTQETGNSAKCDEGRGAGIVGGVMPVTVTLDFSRHNHGSAVSSMGNGKGLGALRDQSCVAPWPSEWGEGGVLR